MRHDSRTLSAPAIIMSVLDQERLTGLATAALDRVPEVAEELLAEMARATVVEDEKLPAAVVSMGSTVGFSSDGGAERRVTLVYPGEAGIAEGRISILTPVGAALIGLSEGQTIVSSRRDGREQNLTVLSVARADG
jgi:regulator of nucleoside diphosphate kinase